MFAGRLGELQWRPALCGDDVDLIPPRGVARIEQPATIRRENIVRRVDLAEELLRCLLVQQNRSTAGLVDHFGRPRLAAIRRPRGNHVRGIDGARTSESTAATSASSTRSAVGYDGWRAARCRDRIGGSAATAFEREEDQLVPDFRRRCRVLDRTSGAGPLNRVDDVGAVGGPAHGSDGVVGVRDAEVRVRGDGVDDDVRPGSESDARPIGRGREPSATLRRRGERHGSTAPVRWHGPEVVHATTVVGKPDVAAVGRPLRRGRMFDLDQLIDREAPAGRRLRAGGGGDECGRREEEP